MRKITLLTAVTLGAAVLCGCSLLQDAGNHLVDSKNQTISLELPSWPDYLPKLSGWKICLYEAGSSRTVEADNLKIKVPRNRPCCIIAQPLVKAPQNQQSSFFKCAGALYPYAGDGDGQKASLSLSWTGGYAAFLMKSIFVSGLQAGYSAEYTQELVSKFNWERLLQTLEQKNGENPWLLDTQQVLEGISLHNFTANKLKSSGIINAIVTCPVFSSYIPENEKIRQQNGLNEHCVSIKSGQKSLFALDDGQFSTGILIYGTSVKNISLEFISLPIYIIEEI